MVRYWYGAIDFRKDIEVIKKNGGFRWISLRSVDLTKRCTECLKKLGPQYEDPAADCTLCMGIGYPFIDKLVKAFRYLSAPGFDFLSSIGTVNTKTVVYILEHDAFPKNTDYIIELDLDESTGIPRQPFSIRGMFKINDSHDMRGKDGRIEFFRCYVEEHNFDRGRTIK